MQKLTVIVIVSSLVVPLFGQGLFECQGPPCTYQFPVGLGAGGDCEGVSWNGAGSPVNVPTVDIGPTFTGMPAQGAQYLRVPANGPEPSAGSSFPLGTVPATLSGNANEVYVLVPPGAIAVNFRWDFYNTEVAAARNDGMLIDVLDGNGLRLALLAFADGGSPQGECQDLGSALCASGGTEIGGDGPETVTAGVLPAGSAFLRVAVWNGSDNTQSSHGVLDDVMFVTSGGGQPPQPGFAVLDMNNSSEANGFPVSSVFPGPYFGNVTAGTSLVMHFEGPANAPFILFAAPLSVNDASFGAIGQLDVLQSGISVVGDGNDGDFISTLFRLQPSGMQDINAGISVALSGVNIDFQSLMFGTPTVVSLSNAVSLTIL